LVFTRYRPSRRRAGRFLQELTRLRRYGLIIVDGVGCFPSGQDAAYLLSSSPPPLRARVADPHQQPPFQRRWGGVFGDQAVAAAMNERIVHHADVLTLKGARYRLRGEASTASPASATPATLSNKRGLQPFTFRAPKPTRLQAPSTFCAFSVHPASRRQNGASRI